MTRAAPLPASLQGRPFLVAEGRAAGVARSRMRAVDLVIPTRGVRTARRPDTDVEVPHTQTERMKRLRRDLIRRAAEFAPALTPDQFYSGSTGLALLGTPLPYTTNSQLDLHVAARHPAGAPRRAGTVGHRLAAREPQRWRAGGLPIEHPARLWRQAAEEWSLDDLIVAGDHLVLPRHHLIGLRDLQDEAAAAVHGQVLLVTALEEIRVGAESAQETHLRLIVTRAGLPWPELNWELRLQDGRLVARLDLAWPKYRVTSEYDGRGHAFDEAQFARDADRWDDIRQAGWDLVRILSHHMRPDPQVALDKITRALWNAGWRPGRD